MVDFIIKSLLTVCLDPVVKQCCNEIMLDGVNLGFIHVLTIITELLSVMCAIGL